MFTFAKISQKILINNKKEYQFYAWPITSLFRAKHIELECPDKPDFYFKLKISLFHEIIEIKG